jgi:Domain of unknown function (DUF4129)
MTSEETADPPIRDNSTTTQTHRLSRVGRRSASIQEGAASLIVLVSAILLEVLPIVAWMIVFSAAIDSLGRLPLPVWWLCVIVFAAWSTSVVFRRGFASRSEDQRTTIIIRLSIIAGWALTVVLSLLLSPGAYAGMPLPQMIAGMLSDVVTGASRLGVDVGLALLAAYLWWRGLLLGRLPLARERLYSRGLWGGIVLLASLIFLNNLPVSTHAQATALLALLLPAYIFIALTGVGLAHLLDTIREHQRRQQRAVSVPDGPPEATPAGSQPLVTRSWIISALGLSTAIVGGALILGLVLSYDSVQALAQLLHPVADAFGVVLTWLVEALAFVLYLLLNGIITWLYNFFLQREKQGQQSTQTPSTPRHLPNTSIKQVPPEWLLAGRIALLVILVIVVALVFWWALRRFASGHRTEEFEEEREALSASEVLGAQLQAFMGRFRRSSAAPQAAEDPLAHQSVRYLYRTMLEQAAAAGLGRKSAETPDEYELRLQVALRTDVEGQTYAADTSKVSDSPHLAGRTAGQVRGGLEELTAAYDQARYGSQPETSASIEGPASPRLQAAVSSIVGWLDKKVNAQRSSGAHPQRFRRRLHQAER